MRHLGRRSFVAPLGVPPGFETHGAGERDVSPPPHDLEAEPRGHVARWPPLHLVEPARPLHGGNTRTKPRRPCSGVPARGAFRR